MKWLLNMEFSASNEILNVRLLCFVTVFNIGLRTFCYFHVQWESARLRMICHFYGTRVAIIVPTKCFSFFLANIDRMCRQHNEIVTQTDWHFNGVVFIWITWENCTPIVKRALNDVIISWKMKIAKCFRATFHFFSISLCFFYI